MTFRPHSTLVLEKVLRPYLRQPKVYSPPKANEWPNWRWRLMAEAGGLMAFDSYTSDFQALTATYVDKILKGTKPSDLPVQQPTKFELFINMRTAKTLGLTVPPSLIVRADELIE